MTAEGRRSEDGPAKHWGLVARSVNSSKGRSAMERAASRAVSAFSKKQDDETEEMFSKIVSDDTDGLGHDRERNKALIHMLMIRREVTEDVLQHYHFLQHPEDADRGWRSQEHRHLHHTEAAVKLSMRHRFRRSSSLHGPENPRSIFCLPMFSPTNSLLLTWTVCIILIDAFYTALWVPISSGFSLDHRLNSSTGLTDFIMGIILCIDILFRFHTPINLSSAFLSTTLTDGLTVAQFYVLRGTFVLDFFAAVPLVIIPLLPGAGRFVFFVLVFRILRLWRVKKVINMLFYVQMMSINGAGGWRMILGNVISTLYTIFVMVNFMASLWYYVGKLSDPGIEGWLAMEYKFNGLGDEERCNEHIQELVDEGNQADADRVDCAALWFTGGKVKMWSISVYYVVVTLTTVGYGDITPASMPEIWTSLAIMVGGLALFASILGSIADIVATGSRKAQQEAAVRSKLTAVQQWMADRNLSTSTRREVLRFYADDWKAIQDDQASILAELPCDVAGDAIWDLVRLDFKIVPLFDQLLKEPPPEVLEIKDKRERQRAIDLAETATMREIASKLIPMNLVRGTHIAKQGDDADALYFLQRGEVHVLHLSNVVTTVVAPAVIGEAALLRGEIEVAKRRFSGYKTSVTSMLWRLDMDELDSIGNLVPNLYEELYRGLKRTVYLKLCYINHISRLETIRYFLKQLQGSAARKGRIEKMMQKLVLQVDMALVQILAYYDRQHYQMSRTGLSTVKSSTHSPRHISGRMSFLPHSLAEGAPTGTRSHPASTPRSPHDAAGSHAADIFEAANEALPTSHMEEPARSPSAAEEEDEKEDEAALKEFDDLCKAADDDDNAEGELTAEQIMDVMHSSFEGARGQSFRDWVTAPEAQLEGETEASGEPASPHHVTVDIHELKSSEVQEQPVEEAAAAALAAVEDEEAGKPRSANGKQSHDIGANAVSGDAGATRDTPRSARRLADDAHTPKPHHHLKFSDDVKKEGSSAFSFHRSHPDKLSVNTGSGGAPPVAAVPPVVAGLNEKVMSELAKSPTKAGGMGSATTHSFDYEFEHMTGTQLVTRVIEDLKKKHAELAAVAAKDAAASANKK